MLTSTWPMPGSQLLGFRWRADERVDLAVGKELHRGGRLADDPVDVLARVEPDSSDQGGDEHQRGRGQDRNRYAPPFQVGNAPNVVAGEQLLTADMHSGEDRDRLPPSIAGSSSAL